MASSIAPTFPRHLAAAAATAPKRMYALRLCVCSWRRSAAAARPGALLAAAARQRRAFAADADADDGGKPRRQRRATPKGSGDAAAQSLPWPASRTPSNESMSDGAAAADTTTTAVRLERGPTDAAFERVASWVVFSDLHVSVKTLDTCLQVLRRVHAEAMSRGAGVLFLGDFWDRRGDLPVAPLNAVVAELQRWRGTPLLLLPGNHDQVDLQGEVHSLAPLAAAASASPAHVFTRPALWRGALWLPYRRREAELRGAIAAATGGGGDGVDAVFAHADVLTAHMNASYQARDGLPPGVFPASAPTYMGHYHYPHTVAGTNVTYVGSPYEVSRSEAGQRKRLLVLNAADAWRVADEVALDIGPRFFRVGGGGGGVAEGEAAGASGGGAVTAAGAAAAAEAASVEDALAGVDALRDAGTLRAGDAVRCVLAGTSRLPPAIEAAQRSLAEQGVQLEVLLQPPARPARIAAAEGMGLGQLLDAYADAARMAPAARAAARELLAALPASTAGGAVAGAPAASTRLEFDYVELEGWGPFLERARYPLRRRGVVALTGRNEDDGAADSNGAGKTSLVSALFWAFRPRLSAGARGTAAEVVHEDSRRGAVRVAGAVNGRVFLLERTAARVGRGSLRLWLDGEEATLQEARLTEALLERTFSASTLSRTLSFGQDELLRLAAANDREFKDTLGAAVDLDAWAAAERGAADALASARRALGEARAAAGVVRGMTSGKEVRLAEAVEAERAWRAEAAARRATAEAEAGARRAALASALGGCLALRDALARFAAGAAPRVADLHTAAERAAAAAATQAAAPPSPPPRAAPTPAAMPSFDEAAAAAALEPLRAAAADAERALSTARGAAQVLAGRVEAALQRLRDYEALPRAAAAAMQRDLIGGGGGGGAVVAAAVTAPALQQQQQRPPSPTQPRSARGPRISRPSGVGRTSVAAQAAVAAAAPMAPPTPPPPQQRQAAASVNAPPPPPSSHAHAADGAVCDRCYQPIDAAAFARNAASLRRERDAAAARQQEAEAAADAPHAELARAQAALQARLDAQAAERAAVVAAREAVMREAAAAGAAAAEAARAHAAALEAARGEEAALARELRALEAAAAAAGAAVEAVDGALPRLAAAAGLTVDELAALARGVLASTAADLDIDAASRAAVAAATALRAASAAADAAAAARETAEAAAAAEAAGAPAGGGAAAQLELLEADVAELRAELASLDAACAAADTRVAALREAAAAFGRAGVPSFVLEGALGELQEAAGRYLSALASGMSLELSATRSATAAATASAAPRKRRHPRRSSSEDGDAAAGGDEEAGAAAAIGAEQENGDDDAPASQPPPPLLHPSVEREEISKIVRIAVAGGELRARSISQLSGGERKRVGLALGLGLVELLAARGRMSSSLLVLDEALEKLDAEGCARVAALLRGLPHETVLVVGQAASFVAGAFGAPDVVVKRGGAARVELAHDGVE